MKVCSKCGFEYEEKPRFCERCGSYFVDANDPAGGRYWKGVILADGSVSDNTRADVTIDKRHGKAGTVYAPDKASLVWGILAVAFASYPLRLNILGFFTDMFVGILGLPAFIFAIIAARKSQGMPVLHRIATIMLVLSAVFFCIGIMME